MAQQNRNKERLSVLMSEFESLDQERDTARIREILAEGSLLVDKQVQPKKWAAFRKTYAQFSETVNPQAAIAAYREALTALDPATDTDLIQSCRRDLGLLLINQMPTGADEYDEIIRLLEASVDEYPDLALKIAILFRFRPVGDPWENWNRSFSWLKRYASGISKEEEPEQWAQAQNELGIAVEEEPYSDFNKTLKTRIRHHLEALAAVDGSSITRVRTLLYLSECFLFLWSDNLEENFRKAEKFGREALSACEEAFGPTLRAEALIGLARIMLNERRQKEEKAFAEGLEFLDAASALINPEEHAMLAATIGSFRANAFLKLIQAGRHEVVEQLIEHVENALRLLSGKEHQHARRSLFQIAGEGLLAAQRYEEAVDYFRNALKAAETSLAEAETIAGKMERIWEFRDSSALLSWCLLRLGRTVEALLELDNGKARFWNSTGTHVNTTLLHGLVPDGGALLFANFAADPGAVVIVTSNTIETVWLPAFGRKRVMELQRGGMDVTRPPGGWLEAYSFSNSRHMAWRKAIETTCRLLYEEMWAPLLEKFPSLEIRKGAELVWFPQGGSGIFPVHASWHNSADGKRQWLLDKYIIRYAPSFHALLSGNTTKASHGKVLMIANPAGDLKFSELECAWVQRILEDKPVQVLHRQQAAPAAVLDALQGTSTLHVASHAVFDLNRPLHSFLMLSAGSKLSLKELLPTLKTGTLDLVVLSACETGRARVTSTPDEFLGFPAAFLHTGTNSVLATLWPIDDEASALLVGFFYRELIEHGKSPAAAL